MSNKPITVNYDSINDLLAPPAKHMLMSQTTIGMFLDGMRKHGWKVEKRGDQEIATLAKSNLCDIELHIAHFCPIGIIGVYDKDGKLLKLLSI